MKEELWELEADVERWLKEMNDHGIWLFLGCLGCLGVGNTRLRLGACIILALIYVYMVSTKILKLVSFYESARSLRAKIAEASEEEIIWKRIREECLSADRLYTASLISVICLLFFIGSFVVVLKEYRPG